MPRIDNRDPNIQRPNRRERDYGIYKLVNELSNEKPLSVKPGETPNIQQFRGDMGTTQFGRSNVTITGRSPYSEIADLLSATGQAASAYIQSEVALGRISDKQSFEDIQKRIGELNPGLTEYERTLEEKKIYEEYEEKLKIRDNKIALDQQLNKYNRNLPRLKDDQTLITLEERLAEIEGNTELDSIRKEEQRILAYGNARKDLLLRGNKAAVLTKFYKAKSNLGVLRYKDVARDFEQGRYEILAQDFGNDEDGLLLREKALAYHLETYEEIFTEYFKDDPELMEDATLLLTKNDANLRDRLTGVEEEIERENIRKENNAVRVARERVREFKRQIEGSSYVQDYLNEVATGQRDLIEDPLRLYHDFAEFVQTKDPSLSSFLYNPEGSPTEIDDLVQEELTSELMGEGRILLNRALATTREAVIGKETATLDDSVREYEARVLSPAYNPNSYHDDIAPVLTSLQTINEEDSSRSIGIAVSAIHTMASARARTEYDNQEDMFVQTTDELLSELSAMGFSEKQVKSIREGILKRKYDPRPSGTQSIDKADKARLEAIYDEDNVRFNPVRFKAAFEALKDKPWSDRSLYGPEITTELTGMFHTYAGLVVASSDFEGKLLEHPLIRGRADKEEILAIIRPQIQAAINVAAEHENGDNSPVAHVDVADAFTDFLRASKEMDILGPMKDEVITSVMIDLFSNDVVYDLINLRHDIAADMNTGHSTGLDLDHTDTLVNNIVAGLSGANPLVTANSPEEVMLQVAQSPLERVEAAIKGTEDQWLEFVHETFPTSQTTTILPPDQRAEAVVERVTELLLTPGEPLNVIFSEGGPRLRPKLKKVLESIDPRMSDGVKDDVISSYIEPLLADPTKLETLDRFKNELTERLTVQYFRGQDYSFQPLSEDRLSKLDNAYQVFQAGLQNTGLLGNTSTQGQNGFINRLFNSFEYDVAEAFLMHTADRQGQLTVADLAQFMKERGFKVESDFQYVASRPDVSYQNARYTLTPLHEADSPQHMSNHAVISFGQRRTDGQPYAVSEKAEFKKAKAAYLEDLRKDSSEGRFKEVERFLNFDWNSFEELPQLLFVLHHQDNDRFVQGGDTESLLKQAADLFKEHRLRTEGFEGQSYGILPNQRDYSLARLSLATLTPNGLSYRGLVSLDIYARAKDPSFRLDRGSYKAPVDYTLREGETYFQIKDMRLDAPFEFMPTEVYYFGNVGHPEAVYVPPSIFYK